MVLLYSVCGFPRSARKTAHEQKSSTTLPKAKIADRVSRVADKSLPLAQSIAESEYPMHRLHARAEYPPRRQIWIAVSCCCVALLLSCALGLLSMQQQWVPLPAFAMRL